MVKFVSRNLVLKARNQALPTSPAPWLLIHASRPVALPVCICKVEEHQLMMVGGGCLIEKLFLRVRLGKCRKQNI